MPNEKFPQNAVRVHEHGTRLGLSSRQDTFAYFTFEEFGPNRCSLISRVVLGRDRDQVERYATSNPEIPEAPQFSGTSDFGFGPVVVVSDDGAANVHADMAIFIIKKEPVGALFAAQDLAIAETMEALPQDLQDEAIRLQANCEKGLSDGEKQRLKDRVRKP